MKESEYYSEIDNCHEKYKTVKYSVAGLSYFFLVVFAHIYHYAKLATTNVALL